MVLGCQGPVGDHGFSLLVSAAPPGPSPSGLMFGVFVLCFIFQCSKWVVTDPIGSSSPRADSVIVGKGGGGEAVES